VYRSGQRILDAAHSLIVSGATEEEQTLREKLESKSGVEHSAVEIREFDTVHDEQSWLAEAIERQIGEGVEPSDIAVLYRTNGEAEHIARLLESRGLSVEVESDQNALSDPEIRKLIVLIRALAHFGQDERLSAALHLDFLGISPLDFYKMARFAQKEHVLIADVMRNEKRLHAAKVDDPKALLAHYRQLEEWARGGESVLAVVDSVVRDSGFLAHILNTQRAVELIEKLAGLMRDIQTLAAGNPEYTLADLSAHIALLEAYRIPVRKELRAAPRKGAIRLMTAHKSKGLEFEYVYVVNVLDGVWGGRRESKHFALPAFAAEGSDDDERRLLYVALTRAKHAVFVSHAQERSDGKAALPSRLLEMIDEELLTRADAPKAPPRLLAETRAPHATLPDKSFLNELFVEQGLSVTALNNYLACPWNYFYSNLVRIPKMPNKHMLFGTAVHQALRSFFDSYREDVNTPLSVMLAAFEESAKRLPFHNSELEESLTRGKEFLTGWYEARRNDWTPNLRVEYRITTELPLADGPVAQVRLRGDLDKIDIYPNNSVRVTDYKTGKPKTRNAIMGLTKTDDGGYWRQLIFYKMLLELEGKYTFQDAVLDFVQPDTKGRFKQEQFFVSDDDVADIKQTIARVSNEIFSLTFWDTRCDKKDCDSCALRNLMR
jgi:DNA helicase-2/ATP-dependent DNA helicase PcrA